MRDTRARYCMQQQRHLPRGPAVCSATEDVPATEDVRTWCARPTNFDSLVARVPFPARESGRSRRPRLPLPAASRTHPLNDQA